MKIKKITTKEVETIYNNHIIHDFPENERRPLYKIIQLINTNLYIPYALYSNEKVIGYAFFYGYNNQYICDYFAIIKEYRNQNYGSYFLKECLKLFQNSQLYFEVETPKEPELIIKQKRIHFYTKNNLIINNIELNLYFVDYIILSNKATSIIEVENLYKQLYDKEFYDKYVKFKGEK